MSNYLMDSFAWIEYFIGSQKGEVVSKIVSNANNHIFTSLVTFAEVISITERECRDVDLVYYSLLALSKFTGLSPEFSKEVGIIHAKTKKKISNFGLADAFILAAARQLDAKIVTGDPHFKDFKNVIII